MDVNGLSGVNSYAYIGTYTYIYIRTKFNLVACEGPDKKFRYSTCIETFKYTGGIYKNVIVNLCM